MAIPEDKARVQAIIDRKVLDKIDFLAGRMGISQSKMISHLLEGAVQDDEWIIRVVTNKYTKKLLEAIGIKKRRKTPEAE
jgi:hypothetical protein